MKGFSLLLLVSLIGYFASGVSGHKHKKSCAVISCDSGYICIEKDGVGKCVPIGIGKTARKKPGKKSPRPRRCKPKRRCPRTCDFGFELNGKGCPTCACKDPCKGVSCPADQACRNGVCVQIDNRCPFGFPLTSNGVEIFCGRGLNRQDCPSGSSCVIHPTDIYAVCCSDSDICIPRACPARECPYGVNIDDNGCPTCDCLDVCEEKDCHGDACIPLPVQCVTTPCPPLAACIDEICTLPSESGNCEAATPRYFYNPDTLACEEFTYGGCDGNANNFETVAECQASCTPHHQHNNPGDQGP